MSNDLFNLKGKVALITGGNSGLGFGFAQGLAKAGADIVLWSRREEKNREAVAKLEKFGGRVISRCVDVSIEQEVADGVDAAVAEMGRIDTVFVNAGFANPTESILDLDSSMYHDLLNVSLHGGFYTLKETARHMAERSKNGDLGGSIVICGSLSIMRGVPGLSHYAAAKGALNSMSKSLAVELGKYQIRVNVIAPGFIATEMTQADPEIFKMMDERYSAATPLGRLGYPDDFEGIAVYLASDSSRYHTGDTIVIDGGSSIT